MTAILSMLLFGACSMGGGGDQSGTIPAGYTSPFQNTTEADPAYDVSSAGVYKGGLVGSSGAFQIYIGNETGLYYALLVFDDSECAMATMYFDGGWTPGAAVADALSSGTLSGGAWDGKSASRTMGRWEEMPWVAERAPEGWKDSHPAVSGTEDPGYEPLSESEEEVDIDARKRAWARLLAKVYEVDPLVCPKCGAEMKVIAIIEDPDETGRILRHLVKNGRSPPGFEADRLN